MGWGVYRDPVAPSRWAGYMVPAVCDWPDCTVEIDRGLAYRCEEHWVAVSDEGGEAEEGCGLSFCEEHRYETERHDGVLPKPDVPQWLRWVLMDGSWSAWRNECPDEVRAAQRQLALAGQ